MCGPGDKMQIVRTFWFFCVFQCQNRSETEVLGREKTETEFNIPQPPNTITKLDCILLSARTSTFEVL